MVRPLNGVERIAAERQRQIEGEHFDADHDDEHIPGELAEAAICYLNTPYSENAWVPSRWPWEASWWKPSADPIRNLVRAGALIAAEIDRIQRQGGTGGMSNED